MSDWLSQVGDWFSSTFSGGLGNPGVPGGLGQLDEEQRRQMMMQSLMGLGQGLLSASGPSTTRVGFGQALGAGMQGMQQAQGNYLKSAYLGEKMKGERAERVGKERQQQALDRITKGIEGEQNRQAAIAAGPGSTGEENAAFERARNAPMYDPMVDYIKAFPKEYAVSQFAKERQNGKWENIDGQLVWIPPGDPTVTGRMPQVFSGAGKRPAEGMVLNQQSGQWEYDPSYMRFQLQKATAGRPVTTVQLMQEGEEKKEVGKFFGQSYAEMQKAGFTANQRLANIEQFLRLQEETRSGFGAETEMKIKRFGKALGLDLGNVGPAEAMKALSARMTLDLGEKMKGPMSDRDREFLTAGVAGLDKTPEGNALMLEFERRGIQYEKARANKARELRERYGQADERLYNDLQTWADQNPIFTDKDVERAIKARGGASGGGTGLPPPPPGAVIINPPVSRETMVQRPGMPRGQVETLPVTPGTPQPQIIPLPARPDQAPQPSPLSQRLGIPITPDATVSTPPALRGIAPPNVGRQEPVPVPPGYPPGSRLVETRNGQQIWRTPDGRLMVWNP